MDNKKRFHENETQDRVARYFRQKAKELSAAADAAICQHPSLIGGHREALQRTYLSSVLPKRFSVGRGMVYGPWAGTSEADIVIWDSQNYPSLPLQDHAFFFVESVRLIVECKSRWSDEEFIDVKRKVDAMNAIARFPREGTLTDSIRHLQAEVFALKSGRKFEGFLYTPESIGQVAVFLKGGQSVSPQQFEESIETADQDWPDLILFLEAGKVVIKSREAAEDGTVRGLLKFFDFGEDCLLAFTAEIFRLLHARSVQVEDPLFLIRYAASLQHLEPSVLDFPLKCFMPAFRPVWSEDEKY